MDKYINIKDFQRETGYSDSYIKRNFIQLNRKLWGSRLIHKINGLHHIDAHFFKEMVECGRLRPPHKSFNINNIKE